ncbi:acyl-CoA dehydratase activase [Microaerobacter geothermalis]|nr:acyl-CoA dehydratase activase [Microaerobacter geothermalis]
MTIKSYIGVDIGSATAKVMGIDEEGNIIGKPVYIRHDEHPSQVDALKYAFQTYLQSDDIEVAGVGLTGSGRELNSKIIGGDLTRTEIFAHSIGIKHLVDHGFVPSVDKVGSIIEIGGQDAKVIIFDENGFPTFFNMNTICSAGTGEFLKQLADDAGIPLRDFGPIALQANRASRIDATCTVFSKRDFRHLTQKGVPLSDRLAGVCMAMANNYLLNVVKDYTLHQPIFFQGGVAFNSGVKWAFENRLKTKVIVPPYHDVVGALGMAVIVRDHFLGLETMATSYKDDFFERVYESQIRFCHGCQNACELTQPLEKKEENIVILDTLGGRCEGSRQPKNVKDTPQSLSNVHIPVLREARTTPGLSIFASRSRSSMGRYFAGIDGGSRGTKYALLKSLGDRVEIMASGSVDTSGDALGAILKALEKIASVLPEGAELSGIGTTGSAGELARDIITRRTSHTADVKSTEIIAHYAWASYMVPEVGVIMDIGGNDAKIIVVKENGLDFAMNDKCAAGSGSFIESVSRRFEVPIDQFADVALHSTEPARIAGRCAVFGESDMIHKSRMGFPTHDLFMGLAYSICRTYLSDIGKGKVLRIPIVAQGGTFLNKAIQEAFRKTLQLSEEEFIIFEDNRLVLGAGALGAALISKGTFEQGHDSHFKGFESILSSTYVTVTTTCFHHECPRICHDVVALLENGQPIAGYKSIDCDFGMFDGLITEDRDRQKVNQWLQGVR